MSAAHRSLARLPLDLFVALKGPQQQDAESLRSAICLKLKNSKTTTVGKLLKLSPLALLRTLDPLLTYDACQELLRRISIHCAPSPTSALELLQADHELRYLPTGMPSLDKCLRGGFRVGTLSELVGRAGAGKSHLGLQLCVIAAKYKQGSIYIDTEKKLSLERLKEIAEERSGANKHDQDETTRGDAFSYGTSLSAVTDEECYADSWNEETDRPYSSVHDVLSNVTVHTAGATSELLSVVAGIEEEILIRNQDSEGFPVRLVVLDSIAAPARRDFGAESAPQRVSAVLQLAQMLKRLADQLQLVVVVINQVGLDENAAPAIESNVGSDLVAVKAALGTSWHHCLSTRLLMEHERDPHRLNTSIDDAHNNIENEEDYAWKHERGRIRKATVVKSNVTGTTSMFYEVTASGLVEIRFDKQA